MEEHLSSYLYSRNGVYYFCRRIPEDLKCNYKQNKIALSLRTRNAKAARIKAASLKFLSITRNRFYFDILDRGNIYEHSFLDI